MYEVFEVQSVFDIYILSQFGLATFYMLSVATGYCIGQLRSRV